MQKVVIITGASRGIGAATARLAAKRGYRVCINYARNHDAANQLAEELTQAGASVMTFAANVADEAAVIDMFNAVNDTLGPITALVNNAGILEKQSKLEFMSAGRFERVFAVNVFGAFFCLREAIKRMAVSNGGAGGAVVNVSSRAAPLGAAFEYVDYAASKAALDAMTVGVSQEVAADNIRVNSVRPGLIDTDIHASGGEPGRIARLAARVPMQRGGQADEVANTILWLLSDEASYVTGSVVDVSGGR